MLLLVYLLAFGGSGWSQGSATPEELFSRGVAFLKEEQLEAAEEAFLEAFSKGMDSPLLHHNLGIVYQRQKRHEKAVDEFSKALSQNPELDPSRALRGTSLLAVNRTDEGIADLESALEGIPDNELLRIQLASAYESQGRVLKAVTQYHQISRQKPDDAESAYRLGRAYLVASEWCYGKMAAIAPNSARLHQAMGQNLMGLRDFEAAARAFQKAINSDPELPDVHLLLAHALMRQGKYAEALRAVEEELAIVPWNVGAKQFKAQISARLESSKEGSDGQ